jgi:predicted Zn-dependent protease
MPQEQVSWFALRVADLALRHGRLTEEARSVAEAALRESPADARLVALMARYWAEREAWQEARSWAAQAVAAGADLQTLALLGDAEAALGDSVAARRSWNEVERRAREAPEPFNRQWTQFRLDHGVEPEQTRAILELEIVERPDILGWRMLARARELTGDHAGAARALEEATRQARGS